MTKAKPDRIRLRLWDEEGGAIPIALPARRMWLVGIVFGVFCAMFAAAAWGVIVTLSFHKVRGVFDLMFWLFEAFWLLGWSVGVVLLGALAVLFLFYRESARIQNGRLVHVPQLGPLRIICDYDLARIGNVRLEAAKDGENVRVRFDYDGVTGGIGDAMPRSAAEAIAATIRSAAAQYQRVSTSSREKPAARLSTIDRSPAARGGEPVAREVPIPHDRTGGSRTRTTGLALVAANLLPLLGVLAFEWRLADVMVLYWAESAVIGFYTVMKICVVGKIAAVAAVPFFIGHFGGFMAAHFMFVYGFFLGGFGAVSGEPSALDGLLAIFTPLWPALLALVVSHGASFFANFLRGQEYVGAAVSELMAAPYKRIVVMHLAIIFGGWLVLALKTPMPALVLLVLLKTAVDFRAHAKEHAIRLGRLQPYPAR